MRTKGEPADHKAREKEVREGRWKVLQGSSKKKISAGDEGMFWAKVAY